jgi:uncharacterized repeat protein (TIGR01451 family)
MIWLALALLVLLVSLIFRLGLLAYAIYTLLAILWASRWLTRRWAESLSAERECNRLVADVGDTVAVVIEVRNHSQLPIPWVLIEDLLPRHALLFRPPSLRVTGRRVLLTSLLGQSSQRILYQLQCNRRGYYQIGPVVLETGDLFGLHRRYRVMTRPHFLLVYPRVLTPEGYDIASRRPIGEVRMTYRLFEDPTRIAGVRQYEAGDPLNRIHWRATARTGLLHSKVYEPSTVAGITVLFDFHQQSHPAKDEPFRSELAVTAAASLVNAVYEMGQQVGLMTNGRDAADRIRHEGWAYDLRSRDAAREAAAMLPRSERLRPIMVTTRRGPEQLVQILETLARLELTDGLTFAQLVQEVQDHLPRDATVVAILPRVTPEQAIMLSTLKRQGYAVMAILNLHDEYEFGQAAGLLLAEGIESRQLRDEQSIVSLCNQAVLR